MPSKAAADDNTTQKSEPKLTAKERQMLALLAALRVAHVCKTFLAPLTLMPRFVYIRAAMASTLTQYMKLSTKTD